MGLHRIGLALIMSCMRTLKTSEAAALLNVSPNTLRAWERRFGYPKPQRSAGRHRLYTHGEVAALRDALQQGLSISSAVSRAREALSSDTHALVGALAGFELDRADGAMESALALRSVERSVEEVLLPALAELGERYGILSAPWAFAARWADGWLRRAQRLAPPPIRDLAILVGDATRNELDPDALAVRAFELFCGRSGARVLALPVGGVCGLSDVVESLSPDAVVIAGGHLPDDDIALWAYRVRAATGPLPLALYRRSRNGAKVRTTGTTILPDTPFGAHRQLLALIDDGRSTRVRDVPALSVLAGDVERREAQA
jgi:DNA-binding transcriptional MerR regulator